MAAKEAPPPAPAGEAPKKGKKLLIIVSALVVLLIALAVATALLLTSHSSDGDEDDEDEDEVQTHKSKKGDPAALPVFVALDPFTVNLAPDENSNGQYMQVTLSLEVDNLEADNTLKGWMPRIRNDVTLIMSGKKESEVITKEGKEALAQEIRNGINSIITPSKKGKAPEGPVRAVLFTQIIIQ
jgi:flagellar FliL protein